MSAWGLWDMSVLYFRSPSVAYLSADNPSQVAGSYGGIAFMVMAALFVLVVVALVGWASSVYLFYKVRHAPLGPTEWLEIYGCFAAAVLIGVATFWFGMKSGVRALCEL
jgi:hypothetical protein